MKEPLQTGALATAIVPLKQELPTLKGDNERENGHICHRDVSISSLTATCANMLHGQLLFSFFSGSRNLITRRRRWA
jgi:hypothetical protein